MQNSPHTTTEEYTPVMVSVSQIGQSWLKIGYRIRWRVYAFLRHEQEKKILSYWTRERMYRACMLDLETLANGRSEFGDIIGKVLSSIEKGKQRKRNEKASHSLPYSRENTIMLLGTKRSTSDIEFVLAFLEHFMNLRREVVTRIIFAPKIPSLLGEA